MRQFTTPEQTAKLIELGVGFRPALIWKEPFEGRDTIIYDHFSIGELIEILNRVDDEKLEICRDCGFWLVGTDLYCTLDRELIDALYDMVTLLKERGMI